MSLKNLSLLPWLAWLLLSLGACSADNGPRLSAPEAHARAQAGQLTLIDVRTPEEWRETGVAPGAVRLEGSRPDFAADVLRQVKGDRGAPIALICRTGNRSGRAQEYLRSEGFTQVYNVGEGMAGSASGPGWLARGLPVER